MLSTEFENLTREELVALYRRMDALGLYGRRTAIRKRGRGKGKIMTRNNPWDIRQVECGSMGGLHISGVNHYTGERFSWDIDFYSFRDPKFTSRRYTFHRAAWGQGARERFGAIVKRAKMEWGV